MRGRKASPLLKAIGFPLIGMACCATLFSAGAAWSATSAELPIPKPGLPALRIHGSNTIGAELSPALVLDFLKDQQLHEVHSQNGEHPLEQSIIGSEPGLQGAEIRVELAAHGSATGFEDLAKGATDIAAASRRIKDSEAQQLTRLGDLKGADGEHVIGLDGVAVIVNKANPLKSLTTDQLAGLFSGEIKNWSAIDGTPGPVRIYSRDDKSGTYETFNELVLKTHSKKLSADATLFESSEELSKRVSSDPNGIGFIGLPYVLQTKAVAVSDGGYSAIYPTAESIATEDYPLSRRLFFYTPTANKNPWIDALVKFTLTPAGQSIVARIGFVGQEPQPFKVTPNHQMPAQYLQLAQQAQRLSVNFRFADGGAELDNKAKRDLHRVVDYAKAHKVEHLTLVGFSDDAKNQQRANTLSKLRVLAVRRELAKAGVTTTDVQSFGNALQVAESNEGEKRLRNRRVEVWVYPPEAATPTAKKS